MRGLSLTAVRPLASRLFRRVATRSHLGFFTRNVGASYTSNSSADMGVGEQKVDTTQRLSALRDLMRNQSPVVDAYVVPSEDARKLDDSLLRAKTEHYRLLTFSPHRIHTPQILVNIRQNVTNDGLLSQALPDLQVTRCFGSDSLLQRTHSSAGCAIVTTTKAYLFTDGRYHLQASQELDT